MSGFGMKEEHREILKKNFVNITRDLEVDQILPRMTDIFKQDDEEEIKAEQTKRLRAGKMLDMLPARGENAFMAFINALQEVQPWMADHLSQLAGITNEAHQPETSGMGMKDIHRKILRKYDKEFRIKLHVDEIVPMLVGKEVLDKNSAKQMLDAETQPSKVEKLMNVLPKCGPRAFDTFYSCLENKQPQLAFDFKKDVKKLYPNEVIFEGTPHQESHTKTSSNDDTSTSHSQHSSQSFSLTTPFSQLPQEITGILQDVLDQPPDELFNNDWKLLYKELPGLPRGREDVISTKDSPTAYVLESWVRVKGNEATLQVLLCSLKRCHHGDLVCKIECELGVKYDDQAEAVVDGMANIRLHQSTEPVRCIGSIPERLKRSLSEQLDALQVEVLGDMATKITQGKCNVVNGTDFLEKTKECMTRFLFRELRKKSQHDIVTWMRENLPAGSTGPLHVDDEIRTSEMSYLLRCKITKELTAGGEWKIVAGHVGLPPTDIKLLDQRRKEPGEDVISYWEVRSGSTVGTLYDLLVECGLASVADLL